MPLIKHYDLDIFTPPCEPGAERYSAIARIPTDLSPVLPYLNAVLKGAVCSPEANALTWAHGGRKTVYSRWQIAVSNLEDREEAIRLLEDEIRRANDIWERRAEITPSTRVLKRTTPLAVYKLLPQTNCRQCGEPTCYVFASKLAAGQCQLDQCPVLAEPSYANRLVELQELLVDSAG